jgi:hypothetical protein
MDASINALIDALIERRLNPDQQRGPKIRETLTKFATLCNADAACEMQRFPITLGI